MKIDPTHSSTASNEAATRTSAPSPAHTAAQQAGAQLRLVERAEISAPAELPAALDHHVERVGELAAYMRDDLKKSGLSPEDVPSWTPIRGAGIQAYVGFDDTANDDDDEAWQDDDEAFTSSSDRDAWVPSGYAIPYIDLDGAPRADEGIDEAFIRFKLRTPLQQDVLDDGTIKSGAKYLSPRRTRSHVYIPARTAEILRNDYADVLVVTEGEKKAESLVKHCGIPCVALAGIYMWSDPEDGAEDLMSRRLHPELLEVIDAFVDGAEKPTIVVLFDSDGGPLKGAIRGQHVEGRDAWGKAVKVRNANVTAAAVKLARRIYDSMKMTVALTAAWCPEGKDGAKQGVDDWIVAAGATAVSEALLEHFAAKPTHKRMNARGVETLVLARSEHADSEALAAILRTNPNLFVFGGRPALVNPNVGTITPIHDDIVLAREASRLVQTFEDTAAGRLKPCYIPQAVRSALMRRDWAADSGMRQLHAIATQPVPTLLRGAQPHVCTSGYDQATQIYGAYDAEDWDIPATPSREQYREACMTLVDLLDEVYLQSPADVAAAIAALLTAVARPALDVAPGIVLSAPNPGSGKSYLAEVCARLASSRVVPALVLTLDTATGPQGDGEFSKMVLGALADPAPTMLFDEVNGSAISGASLNKLISSPMFSGRKLGENVTVSMPTRRLILVTANNVDPTVDAARRFVIVRINPPDVLLRRQSQDKGALQLLAEDRDRYVRAAVLVSLGGMHRLAGLPSRMPVGIDALSGFRDWSRVCAGPAVLAAWEVARQGKLPRNMVDNQDDLLQDIVAADPVQVAAKTLDPLARQKQVSAMDPAKQLLSSLLDALWHYQAHVLPSAPDAQKMLGEDGQQAWTVKVLLEEIRTQRQKLRRYEGDYGTDVTPDDFELVQALKSLGVKDDQMSNARSIGRILTLRRDTEVGGHRLVQCARTYGSGKITLWHVESTTAVAGNCC